MDNDVNDMMDIHHVHDIHDIHLYYRPRIDRRRERVDPFNLPDREFKARYRFSKDGVRKLTDILRPYLNADAENMRGLPFSPEQIVTSGFDILGSGLFQRVEGVCSQSGKSSVHKNLYRYI